jgi:uncharacterized protein YcbX
MTADDLHDPDSPRAGIAAPAWRVAELWRYPVKSLAGERMDTLRMVDDGVDGDRLWGIEDRGDGRILTARREPRLLFASARLTAATRLPVLTLPDGREVVGPGPAADAALSAWLGKPVALVSATSGGSARAEFFEDATDDASPAVEWTMPEGRFVDAFPVLVMTTAGLRGGAAVYAGGDWDIRRFRPNILVALDGEGWVEDAWAGRRLEVGAAQIVPRRRCARCTMVNREQPSLAKDVNIYKTLKRTHGGDAGMWSQVARPGEIKVGDAVELT